MNNQIILRVPLDRPPTLLDRWEQIGADEFSKRLQAAGWAAEDGTVLKPFRIEHEGHTEGGKYYIQWVATLL
jgi:hypothetical protein